MKQVDIFSSIDASPTYSGSRRTQFANSIAPTSKRNDGHMGAYAQALANVNQTASIGRMNTENLRSSLAGQQARSEDVQRLASLYGSGAQNQSRQRTAVRDLATQQQINNMDVNQNWMRTLIDALGPIGVLSGLMK